MQSFDADAARVDEQTAAALPAFAVRDAANVFSTLQYCALLQQSCCSQSSFIGKPVIAHQRHLLLPLTSSQVLHDNPLLNTALLRILTVGNVLNNSSAMGSAAGCVRDRCSTHHAAADTARLRLQRMMFAGRFEIACLADLAKLQGNAPDSSMLRSGPHSHAHTHINTVIFWLSHPIVNV
jgi:hypothetical protein